MAEMGMGYGSECHMLRYLGRHRSALDRAVLGAIGQGEGMKWLDFHFKKDATWQDAEWKGVDFLSDLPDVQEAWKKWWPQSGNVQNWDAVGRLEGTPDRDWVLVEAKANLEEIKSSTGASKEGGLDRITAALGETKEAMGGAADRDWLSGYYQYANRLAVLHFLKKHGVSARLLFLYFTGDDASKYKDGRNVRCPADREGWGSALVDQKGHLGIPDGNSLTDRVHALFLPVVF